jgi:hypothetical protein
MDDRLGEYKHKGGRSGGGRCEVSKDGCLYVNKRKRTESRRWEVTMDSKSTPMTDLDHSRMNRLLVYSLHPNSCFFFFPVKVSLEKMKKCKKSTLDKRKKIRQKGFSCEKTHKR